MSKRYSLLALPVLHFFQGPKFVPKRPPVKVQTELEVDEKRFGKAPEELRKPLLQGRRGKLTKAKRAKLRSV